MQLVGSPDQISCLIHLLTNRHELQDFKKQNCRYTYRKISIPMILIKNKSSFIILSFKNYSFQCCALVLGRCTLQQTLQLCCQAVRCGNHESNSSVKFSSLLVLVSSRASFRGKLLYCTILSVFSDIFIAIVHEKR